MDAHPENMAAINVEEHLGLAHLCVKRFFRHGMEYAELVREATLSLVTAAGRFDPARGVSFSTYAVPCILFDLRRACEKAAPMHVPRQEQGMLRQAAALRHVHLEKTGQEPTVEELAREMGLPAEELSCLVTAQRHMESLGQAGRESAHEKAAAFVDKQAERFVDYLLLLDVIARLPRPMPMLIQLRFVGSHTQQTTARLLHMSQAQVSKLEKQAKQALQEALALA